jgi:7-carboxy-7-deazaguanine synthase
MSITKIINEIKKYDCNLIEITGGEPLLQEQSIELMKKLIKNKYTVMLETGGSLPITAVPEEVIKIVDFKCPSSKMKNKNDWNIINDLKEHDEIKFVIGNREDYEWSKNKINQYNLKNKNLLFSPVHNILDSKVLSEWILEDNLKVRLQIQIHKYIWDSKTTGI